MAFRHRKSHNQRHHRGQLRQDIRPENDCHRDGAAFRRTPGAAPAAFSSGLLIGHHQGTLGRSLICQFFLPDHWWNPRSPDRPDSFLPIWSPEGLKSLLCRQHPVFQPYDSPSLEPLRCGILPPPADEWPSRLRSGNPESLRKAPVRIHRYPCSGGLQILLFINP